MATTSSDADRGRTALIELPLASFIPKSAPTSPCSPTQSRSRSRSASPTKRSFESPSKQRTSGLIVAATTRAATLPASPSKSLASTSTPKAASGRHSEGILLSPGAGLGLSVPPTPHQTTPSHRTSLAGAGVASSSSLLTPASKGTAPFLTPSSSPSHRALFDAVRQSRASSYTTALESSPALPTPRHQRNLAAPSSPSLVAPASPTPKTPRAAAAAAAAAQQGLAPSPTFNYEAGPSSAAKRAKLDAPASLARKAVRVPPAEGRAHIGSPSPRRPTATYPPNAPGAASPSAATSREEGRRGRPTWLAAKAKEEEDFVVFDDEARLGSEEAAGTGDEMMLATATEGEESDEENDENVVPSFSIKAKSGSSSSLEASGSATLDTPRATSSTASAAPTTDEARPATRRKGTGGRLSLLATATGDDSFASNTSTGAEAADKDDTSFSSVGTKRDRAGEADVDVGNGEEDDLEKTEGKRRKLDAEEKEKEGL